MMTHAVSVGMETDLFTGSGKPVYEFLMEHQQDYGEVAPEGVVRTRFPDFELPAEKPANMEFYVDEMRKRRLHNRMTTAMREAALSLKDKDPKKALTMFEQMVLDSQEDVRSSRDVDLGDTALQRVDQYYEMKGRSGIDGYATPWDTLDQATMGWHRQELITVVARLGTGKTWLLVLLAKAIHDAGYTPLVISREMGVHQIARRLDAVKARIPHELFRTGKLTPDQEERYVDTMKGWADKDDSPLWVSGDDAACGVAGLSAKIDQLKPDVVLVDGLYLMQDDRGETGWQGVTNVTRDLKRLARRKDIPVIISTQLNRDGTGTNATTANISYSDSIGMDSDVVLALFQTEDMRLNNEMLVKLLKHREGQGCEFTTRWDLDCMNFEELDDDDDELDDFDTFGDDDGIPF
jgi:replicative DNA helicase